MHVYKLKAFARFQRGQRSADSALADAVRRAAAGLIDADLGGGLIKQRVARPGQGKRGGYRTIIAYREGERAIFLFGFAKNERDNIGGEELLEWRRTGFQLLTLDDAKIEAILDIGELMEVTYGNDDPTLP